MTNGGGVGNSRTPYIIICNGRIQLLTLKNDPESRVVVTSNCATNLVTFYGDKLSAADTMPISGLQHDMMDVLDGPKQHGYLEKIDMMIDQMFALLDALEDKMSVP